MGKRIPASKRPAYKAPKVVTGDSPLYTETVKKMGYDPLKNSLSQIYQVPNIFQRKRDK